VRRLISALLAAGVIVTPAATAFALPRADNSGLGIRLAEAPTSRKADPRARAYIVDHLAPGTTIKRKVQLVDHTTQPMSVSLYAGGATIEGGSFRPLDGHGQNELSTWTSVTPASLSLSPGGSAIAEVTIAVPQNAPPGEQYAVVWGELPPSTAGQIREINRVGIRIYLDVGAGNEPASAFTIDSLTAARAADGTPYVQATVHNTGGRALDMSGSLKLSDGPGGLSAGPFPARLGTTLAPRQSEPVTVPLDKNIPAGPWHARIDLASGLIKRAAEGTITFPAADASAAAPVAATDIPLGKSPISLPLAIAVIAALALLVLLLFFLLWRRRRKDEDEDERKRPGAPRRGGGRHAAPRRA
jgi:hypothetical protein